jgi:ribosomal protein L11 methyltransferase
MPEGRATASSAASPTGADELTRVSATVPNAAADDVRVALAEIAARGWGEEEYGESVRFSVWIVATDGFDVAALNDALRAGDPQRQVVTAVETTDWAAGLRDHHRPVDVGGRIRVRPPWEPATDGVLDIVIDPGMAFGTGQHATTEGCLTLLLDVPAGRLLDVGCGSGILAIAARRLGHDPVWAVDVDPLAVQATIANARANGVGLIVAERAGGRDALPAVDTVVANITERHVSPLVGHLPEPRPSTAILSGFRPADVGIATDSWRAAGYRLVRRIDADNWSAVRLERL